MTKFQHTVGKLCLRAMFSCILNPKLVILPVVSKSVKTSKLVSSLCSTGDSVGDPWDDRCVLNNCFYLAFTARIIDNQVTSGDGNQRRYRMFTEFLRRLGRPSRVPIPLFEPTSLADPCSTRVIARGGDSVFSVKNISVFKS